MESTMSITSRWIDIPAGNDSFGGYLALPQGGKGPAVIIIQEIFGVNGHIRSVADQYAQDGYVALAPDVFWRVQPRVELTYEGADRTKGVELMQKLNGRLAYLAAAQGTLDGAVAYYGGGIQNQLDEAAKIKVPMQFHYGELDAHIPLSAVGQIQERFAGRTDAEFHIYPNADHGFNCSERASYNQRASALAHGRTLTFLGERL
jgi:carboxymethylenebutenolidase